MQSQRNPDDGPLLRVVEADEVPLSGASVMRQLSRDLDECLHRVPTDDPFRRPLVTFASAARTLSRR